MRPTNDIGGHFLISRRNGFGAVEDFDILAADDGHAGFSIRKEEHQPSLL